jgi:secreted trypsin-like serine protease
MTDELAIQLRDGVRRYVEHMNASPATDYWLERIWCLPLLVGALAAMAGTLGVSAASAHAADGKGGRPYRESSAHSSVVGGKMAAPGTFPWMAFVVDLRGEEGIACSGTVVAPNLVLTAAHCAVNLETGATSEAAGYRVVTGNVNWASPERQVSDVSRVLVYPRFKIGRSSSGLGDAALLVLSTPTTASAISLATSANAKRLRTGTHAMIAGWGETHFGQTEPTESLMWARTVVEGNQCEGLRGRICAIDFPKFKSGVCHGDSGGPLLAAGPHGQGLIEIGITQAVFSECTSRRPGIFTRADLISPWADRWISTLNPPS